MAECINPFECEDNSLQWCINPLSAGTIVYGVQFFQSMPIKMHIQFAPLYLGFPNFWGGIIIPYWSSLVPTGPHWFSPVLTSPYWFSPVLTGSHRSSPVLTSPHWFSLVITSPHWVSPVLTGPHHRGGTLKWAMSLCVCILASVLLSGVISEKCLDWFSSTIAHWWGTM